MSAEHETLRERLLSYPCLLPIVAYAPQGVQMGRVVLPPISPTELQLVPGLDGGTAYEHLIEQNPSYENLTSFVDHLVWWDRPLENERKAPRSSGCLVISAHPDDVELSMGGWLIQQRNRREITHAICFSQVGYTQFAEAFPSPCEATAVRRSEATLAARMLGLYNVDFNLPDFELRRQDEAVEQLHAREQAAGRLLRIELCRLIERTSPQTIFAPAAIGNHPDHRIIFNAVLDVFDTDCFPDTTVHFYEDVPYSAQYRHIDSFLARFETSYLTVDPWVEDISEVLELKQTLCEVHRSQSWPGQRELLEAIAVRTAEFLEPPDEPDGVFRAAERFWTLAERVLLGN
jgi:LmbE family N-acetylglucosaminyl deacetylase